MNLNIVNNFDEILQFLQNTMSQLKNYNSINETDLKLLCYLMYKQDTIERNNKKVIENIKMWKTLFNKLLT